MKAIRNISFKFAQASNRNLAIEQGFYDGRYCTKIVADKKKIIYKKYRKNKILYKTEYE